MISPGCMVRSPHSLHDWEGIVLGRCSCGDDKCWVVLWRNSKGRTWEEPCSSFWLLVTDPA